MEPFSNALVAHLENSNIETCLSFYKSVIFYSRNWKLEPNTEPSLI